MAINKQAKMSMVDEIKEKLSKAQSAVVIDYRGLTVDEANKLRALTRESNVEYKIYKNNMVNLAVQGTEFEELSKVLEGPSGFAFGYDDAVAPARVLNGFIKDVKKGEFKAGVIEGQFYDSKSIKDIAMLPTRDELIAKFLGSIKSPLSNFAYMLNAIVDNPDCLKGGKNEVEKEAKATSEETKEEVAETKATSEETKEEVAEAKKEAKATSKEEKEEVAEAKKEAKATSKEEKEEVAEAKKEAKATSKEEKEEVAKNATKKKE